MEMDLKLEGFKEMDNLLKMMPDDIAKRVLESAARESLKPVLDDAKNRVPVKTGQLYDSLSIKKAPWAFKKYDSVMYEVGTNLSGKRGHRAAPHAHLIEFGTAGGTIKTGPFAGAKIPPLTARPFMRPAFDNNVQKVLDYLKAALWRGISSSAKRLAK